MGFFDFLQKKEESWDTIDVYEGETPPCPNCGTPLVKRFVYSDVYCSNCHYGLDSESDDGSEALSVNDAALIWGSNGKDEDYMFGYSWQELENAL